MTLTQTVGWINKVEKQSGWTEETIANCGSLLLQQRIYRNKDIFPASSIKPAILNYLQQEQHNYVLFIQPEPALLDGCPTTVKIFTGIPQIVF